MRNAYYPLMNPGDKVLPETTFSGENLCYRCSGEGKRPDSEACHHCDGTGLIRTIISG